MAPAFPGLSSLQDGIAKRGWRTRRDAATRTRTISNNNASTHSEAHRRSSYCSTDRSTDESARHCCSDRSAHCCSYESTDATAHRTDGSAHLALVDRASHHETKRRADNSKARHSRADDACASNQQALRNADAGAQHAIAISDDDTGKSSINIVNAQHTCDRAQDANSKLGTFFADSPYRAPRIISDESTHHKCSQYKCTNHPRTHYRCTRYKCTHHPRTDHHGCTCAHRHRAQRTDAGQHF